MARRSYIVTDCSLGQVPAEALSEVVLSRIIEEFTTEGDRILDPFLGFGTVAKVAIKKGRSCVGFEIDPQRVALALAAVAGRAQIIQDNCCNIGSYNLPIFDAVITSPPFPGGICANGTDLNCHVNNIANTLSLIAQHVRPGGVCLVETGNPILNGRLVPYTYALAMALRDEMIQIGELVCCCSDSFGAIHGADHTTILVFRVSRNSP